MVAAVRSGVWSRIDPALLVDDADGNIVHCVRSFLSLNLAQYTRNARPLSLGIVRWSRARILDLFFEAQQTAL